MLSDIELKEFPEEKHNLYKRPSFTDSDPIQIPHQFSKKEDIEITVFLTSQIAWGNRKMIKRVQIKHLFPSLLSPSILHG